MIVRRSLVLGCLAAACALLGTLAGCGSSSTSGGGSGTLRVAMVDAPDPTVTAVHITLDRVEAHVNNEWVPITVTPQTYDLMDLVQNEAIIGTATLLAGRYNQVRLFVSNATVTDAAGTHPVTISSADQTGIKVNVNYDIHPNEITTILLDFNVEKSIVKQGNGQYRMQPVIPAVVKVLSGTITGTVTSGGSPVSGATVRAIYTAGPSYPVGTEVNTNMSLSDGAFKVWALLPGTYTVSASFTDPATTVTRTATVTGVMVQANQNTSAGTLDLQ